MSVHTKSKMNKIRVGRNNKIFHHYEIDMLILFLHNAQDITFYLDLFVLLETQFNKFVVCIYVCIHVIHLKKQPKINNHS